MAYVKSDDKEPPPPQSPPQAYIHIIIIFLYAYTEFKRTKSPLIISIKFLYYYISYVKKAPPTPHPHIWYMI